MLIGVDAGCLGITDNRLKVGVYYVAYHLLRELSKIDTKNTYILYSFHPIPKEIMQHFSPSWENIVLPSKGWLYISFPLQFLKQKPDIFLALNQAMPWYHPFKTIGFIHGLDFMPEFHVYGNNLTKLKKNSEFLIHHANVLLTTSDFLKKSLEKEYKNTSIVVASLGVDTVFFKQTKPYTIHKPYFLFVGSLKPSKNIPNILKAFSIFLKSTKEDYQLLCIGSDFWLDTEIKTMIEELQISSHLTFIPFVDNAALPKYYKGAIAFVSPSLYEGFGIPYLEAMAAGCPVIASTTTSAPEIIGNAGLLVNPDDYKSIAKAMTKISEDTSTRNKYIINGLEKAKQFSWRNFAKNVYHIIQLYEY
jgi:glycosyltransferase involved in cell wall biosynthesis